MRGQARHFHSEIVNYADDLCVIGRTPAAEMLLAVRRIMDSLKLPAGEHRTQCLRRPEEPFEFLGYRIGRTCRTRGRGPYIGTRPSKASVQGICRKVSRSIDEHTTGRRWHDPARQPDAGDPPVWFDEQG